MPTTRTSQKAAPPPPPPRGDDAGADAGYKADAAALAGNARELFDYALHYLSAKVDALLALGRNLILLLIMLAVLAVVGLTVLVTATVQAWAGLAAGIGSLFGPNKLWAGELIVGFGTLLLTFLLLWLVGRSVKRSGRDSAVLRYRERLMQQYASHGHNAAERAGDLNGGPR